MGLPFKIKRVNIPAVRTINRIVMQNNETADEIEEYDTLADFPVEGESDILYLDLDTKIYYIWTGASYETQVVLALGETSTTAFRGDQGKTAYDHSQTTHNATFVGLGNVSNVAQLPLSYLDTDTALAANSDFKVASQKAAKAYSDAKVADAINDGTTTVAPSQNAVFDALALKANLASPSFTGTVISAGLIDLSGAGAGQIKFPATQNASANANTLDDYEEGTFSMGLAFAGVSTGITFSANTYNYTKTGDRVSFDGQNNLTNKGSATGAARLNNLPFTVSGAASVVIGYVAAITRSVQMVAYAAGTTIILDDLSLAGVQSNLTDTNFANNSQINVAGTYKV